MAWFGIALIPNAIATVSLALVGAASALISVAAGSARQAPTPDRLLARVVAALRLFGIGAAGLGALTSGLRLPLWSTAALLAVAACAHRP